MLEKVLVCINHGKVVEIQYAKPSKNYSKSALDDRQKRLLSAAIISQHDVTWPDPSSSLGFVYEYGSSMFCYQRFMTCFHMYALHEMWAFICFWKQPNVNEGILWTKERVRNTRRNAVKRVDVGRMWQVSLRSLRELQQWLKYFFGDSCGSNPSLWILRWRTD